MVSKVYYDFSSDKTDDWSWRFPNADERNVNSAYVKCSVNVCKVHLLYDVSQLRCFLVVELEEQPSG